MEPLSATQTVNERNPPVTSWFPSQSEYLMFVVASLNKLLNKQSVCLQFDLICDDDVPLQRPGRLEGISLEDLKVVEYSEYLEMGDLRLSRLWVESEMSKQMRLVYYNGQTNEIVYYNGQTNEVAYYNGQTNEIVIDGFIVIAKRFDGGSLRRWC